VIFLSVFHIEEMDAHRVTEMKIWYDACTGKHIRYGVAVAQRLRKLGHEVILTTRKHPDTLALAEFLDEEPIVVGKYAPASKSARLKESAKRQLLFCRMFEKDPPDIAVMHVSIECARVAFGLGIPLISTFDTPHAEAQCRLTVPLTDTVIVSKAIPPQDVYRYGAKKIVQFEGVDEVAWIRGFKPKMKNDFGKPFIVVRQTEVKAAYAEGMTDITEQIARKLSSLAKVVFLTRYDRKAKKGLVVPQSFVDSASLAAQADLVVSVGGTIAREAALQGTPSIVVPLVRAVDVNDYVFGKKFPLFKVKSSDVLKYAKKYLGRHAEVSGLLADLEDPVDVIETIVEEKSTVRKN
jgi:predicted glycosyltransferase